MAKFSFEGWFSRSANAATFWPLIPSGIIGVLAALFSRGVAAISAYGAFGWLMSGLAGFVLTALGFYLAGIGYSRFALAKAQRKWARDVDNVNPLEKEFSRQRIKVLDLAHPVNGRIKDKRLLNCQLVGRANLVLSGSTFQNVGFLNCDFVIIRDGAFIQNTVVLDNCVLIDSEVIDCTLFIKQDAWEKDIRPMSGNLISYEAPAK